MANTRKRLEELTAGLSLPESPQPPAQEGVPVPSEPGPPYAATGVETRFPPARPGVMAPRTGPGQMLAFRGHMQATEGELAGLRERLRQYENAMPSRPLDPGTVHQSRWANRHPSSFATSAFAGLKADIEKAGGNVQPILVRPMMERSGHYELVFGHRRHRACLDLGIPVLASIWVEELGDAALFAAMDRENRERADLSPYEQGMMYSRALEEQLFPSQRQLADNLGVTHTWVRKALMVAQLPPPVVECFRSPLEISHRHAEQINAGLDRDRRGLLRRAEKLRGQKAAPAAIVAALLDQKPDADRATRCDLKLAAASIGSCARARDGAVTISLSRQALETHSPAELSQAIADALQQLKP